MNRLQRMAELSRRLAAARDADDWDEAAAVDRELAVELARWSPLADRSLAERTLVAELRDIHADTRAHCAQETRRQQRQLAELRAHREGWMAYGLQEPADAVEAASAGPAAQHLQPRPDASRQAPPPQEDRPLPTTEEGTP